MFKLYGFAVSNYYNMVKLALLEKGLPVPQPYAASYVREGLAYRAALLLERLPGVAKGLSTVKVMIAVIAPPWRDAPQRSTMCGRAEKTLGPVVTVILISKLYFSFSFSSLSRNPAENAEPP